MALDPITGIADLASTIGGIVTKFIPDKTAAAQASAELQGKIIGLVANSDQAQASSNANEASNPSVFVAGWRPFIGWVCGISLAWQFIGQPAFSFFWTISTHQPAPVLDLDNGQLFTILAGMLGLGGLRTYEKLNGVTK